MTGLDTNVLVRYLVQDDAAQSRRAEDLLLACDRRGETCFVSLVVLCELVWVLDSRYRRSREEIVEALRGLLRTRQFHIERKEIARAAVDDYAASGADYADFVLGHSGIAEGCSTTATFDRELRGHAAFSLLS